MTPLQLYKLKLEAIEAILRESQCMPYCTEADTLKAIENVINDDYKWMEI